MPHAITCFKRPPWISYDLPSVESSPASSPAVTPPSTRRNMPRVDGPASALAQASGPASEPAPEPASEQVRASSLPDMLGDVTFSPDILDLSSQTADAAAGLAKLQRALGLGDGTIAGIWVQLPNGVRTPMALKRRSDASIELALLYEKRHADGSGPVDRADLLKRLKSALSAGSKTTFKCYGHLTEVWKARNETVSACHRRVVGELQWHASAGRTLHEGLEGERELRDFVGDPAWNVLQKRRTDELSLGFVLPKQATSSSPRRQRDDMTKVIAAKLSPVAADAARSTRVKSAAADREMPYPPRATLTPGSGKHAAADNRTILLDIMPPINE